jgi:hypothetical protein
MGRVSKELQTQDLKYIPALLKARISAQVPTAATVYPPPETTSFTLQVQINPKKVVKRYKQFKFNKYLNEFGFCDETGAEYLVHCFMHDRGWGTVVTISDSLDPVKDINEFFYWLNDNFGA